MKIVQLRDDYHEASGKVSDLVRQLSLAGIAVIWIFRVGTEAGGVKFDVGLLWPLSLFVISLGCDLAQYLSKTLILCFWNSYWWKKFHNLEKEVEYSRKWNFPAHLFFWSKIVVAIWGYALLLNHVIKQLRSQ